MGVRSAGSVSLVIMRLALALLLLAPAAFAATTFELAVHTPTGPVTPGEPLHTGLTVVNRGSESLQDVVARFALPPGTRATLISPEWSCAFESATYVCRRPVIGGGVFANLEFFAVVDRGQAGRIELPVSVEAANAPTVETRVAWDVFHLFVVSHLGDDGPDSLRQALTGVNAFCASDGDCKVVFELQAGAAIEPRTPLPLLTACGFVILDGPLTRAGDRPFLLSGARVASGSGLEIRPRCQSGERRLDIRGFAIGNFPVDGIRIHPETPHRVFISGMFVGTDVGGRVAQPNEWRGISITSDHATAGINESVVSGNRRSGVWIWNSHLVDVHSSLIGAGSDGQPLPNQASGVFILHGIVRGFFNTIAYNAQWGVTAVPGARMGLVHHSSIHSNGVLGLDWGVNGPNLHETISGPAAPVILSATYDAATDRTTIRGTVDVEQPHGRRYEVSIYGNTRPNASGYYEGETWLGRSEMYSIYVPSAGVYPWQVVVPGDVRDRVLTAVTGVGIDDDLPTITGSEFSEPFRPASSPATRTTKRRSPTGSR